MSILADSNTKVIVQGITGRQGMFHATQMLEYGTKVVGGVTPGRGGTTVIENVPVFDSVQQAVDETGANASIIYVPASGAADTMLEAADAGIPLVICITEGVPPSDMVGVTRYLRERGITLIGPNCPGVISPSHRCKIGIMPGEIHLPGSVGVVSRSGTLTYEAVHQLTQEGIGQSTCVGIGGDPIVGTSFVDILRHFNADQETEAVVLIGEIGGTKEQEAAEFIAAGGYTKPLIAVIAGQSAPPGKRMGHAGAIITGTAARASEKTKALENVGATIAPTAGDIGATVSRVFNDLGLSKHSS